MGQECRVEQLIRSVKYLSLFVMSRLNIQSRASFALYRVLLGFVLFAALVLTGCGEDAVATQPDLAIPDSERSKCPESPFRPEFPMAPKLSAAEASIRPFNYDILIYTSRGKFITEMKGVYDPAAIPAGTRISLSWDGRDAAGNAVASGYYFMVTNLTDVTSGASSTRSECLFWINNSDYDKLK